MYVHLSLETFAYIKLYVVEICATSVFVVFVVVETNHMIRRLLGLRKPRHD
jgi:hypothetical protein